MPTPMTWKFTTARNSCARMLKSSSEERIEIRVCETRRRASYRLLLAVSAAFDPFRSSQSCSEHFVGGLGAACYLKLGSEPRRTVRIRQITPASAPGGRNARQNFANPSNNIHQGGCRHHRAFRIGPKAVYCSDGPL